jgi:hypothetical protein
MSENIQIGSKIYPFPKVEYETDESYFIRKEFFITHQPETQKDYKNILTMSIIWSNMKMLGCSYSPEVMDYLNNLK